MVDSQLRVVSGAVDEAQVHTIVGGKYTHPI